VTTTHAPTPAPVAALGQEIVRLSRTTHAMRTALAASAAAREDGVEWAAYGLLFHLVKDGPQRSSSLADAVHVDPSTVSRQVAQLVRQGLVERRPDPEDGRAVLLGATPAGQARHARMRERRDGAIACMLEDWDADDVHRLTTLLARFNDRFEERRDDVVRALGQEDRA